jgi:hypothetical protein
VTVNNKEENSEDFYPNYVQEFGLRCRGKIWDHRKKREVWKEAIQRIY